MKACDLQIGDYVRCGDLLVRVSRVDENSASGIDLCALSPITLTEEILKANDIGYEFYEGFHIWIENDNQTRFVELGGFYFVHEMQHALRLCGMNEKADNFKLSDDIL